MSRGRVVTVPRRAQAGRFGRAEGEPRSGSSASLGPCATTFPVQSKHVGDDLRKLPPVREDEDHLEPIAHEHRDQTSERLAEVSVQAGEGSSRMRSAGA